MSVMASQNTEKLELVQANNNEENFRNLISITGPMWGESTWIPLTKGQ